MAGRGLSLPPEASERLHVFGVRHHGPGCARTLLAALEALDPAAVLIEGPADATPLLPHAASVGMKPPVALLSYVDKASERALFHPFASYSPEWQAMQWALRRDRELRFIDLPAAVRLAEPREDLESDEREAEEAPPPVRTAERVRADPIGVLAELAGQTDGETWWNQLVEEREHAPSLFPAVAAAMEALRESFEPDPDAEPLLERQREAHMRQACARALAEVEGPLAVVVGAWHVPALRGPNQAKDDKALLRGLPKSKVVTTWIPWTSTRLALASGYGAGIEAPGWYAHLWSLRDVTSKRSERIVTGWLLKVARGLREAGLDASTAALIEAQRLALAIAAMDEVPTPGLRILDEALLATLCGGDSKPLELVARPLLIGDEVGRVGAEVPQNPLAEDLERQRKAVRLKQEALERALSLDLRSESGLKRSILLRRLALLGIPWGELGGAGRSRGTFRENWTLRWDPELSVGLAEAVVFGTTVESAAAAKALQEAEKLTDLEALAEWVEACLLADLEVAARRCIQRLQTRATVGSAVLGLMRALRPLASTLRYGTARALPTEALELLVHSLVEQALVGLVYAGRNLDDESAEQMREALTRFDEALLSLERPLWVEDFDGALQRLADDASATPLLAGLAVRRLHERGRLEPSTTAGYLSRALSSSVAPLKASQWLDGFLARSGSVLLFDRALLDIIDAWVTGLEETALIDLLPMLRRAFSTLEGPERRLLMDTLLSGPRSESEPSVASEDNPAFDAALPLLVNLLGLPPLETTP